MSIVDGRTQYINIATLRNTSFEVTRIRNGNSVFVCAHHNLVTVFNNMIDRGDMPAAIRRFDPKRSLGLMSYNGNPVLVITNDDMSAIQLGNCSNDAVVLPFADSLCIGTTPCHNMVIGK